MNCPNCNANDDTVIDSKFKREINIIYRRRKCILCGYRWSTHERITGEHVNHD